MTHRSTIAKALDVFGSPNGRNEEEAIRRLRDAAMGVVKSLIDLLDQIEGP